MELNWLQGEPQANPISNPVAKTGENVKAPRAALTKWGVPLLLGLVTSLCQYALLSSSAGSTVIGGGSSQVLVSKVKIERGELLDPKKFQAYSVQNSELVDAFVTVDELQKYTGRRFLASLKKGEPMPKAMLLTDFEQKSAPERIPPGKRLFVLQANLGELARVLKPDDHIDLVATMNLPGVGETTKTFLENVTLVSVSDEDKKNGHFGNAISLYVTPKEAEFLTFVQKQASFSVVLRNPGDSSRNKEVSGMTYNQFLEAPKIKGVRENDLFEIVRGKKQ